MSEERQEPRRWLVEVEVMPKQGVNDPQGDAVLSGLRALQFRDIDRVRVGKLVRIEIRADTEAEAVEQGTRMCEKLLANPVIEEFVVAAAALE